MSFFNKNYMFGDNDIVSEVKPNKRKKKERLQTEFIDEEYNEYDDIQNDNMVQESAPVQREELKTEAFSDQKTIFVEPKEYFECKRIAKYIKEDITVTVNLEYVDSLTAQRIIDFLSGALSIKGANFIPVSSRVYVAVPRGMNIIFDGRNEK